jgi:hypothetical protein
MSPGPSADAVETHVIIIAAAISALTVARRMTGRGYPVAVLGPIAAWKLSVIADLLPSVARPAARRAGPDGSFDNGQEKIRFRSKRVLPDPTDF